MVTRGLTVALLAMIVVYLLLALYRPSPSNVILAGVVVPLNIVLLLTLRRVRKRRG